MEKDFEGSAATCKVDDGGDDDVPSFVCEKKEEEKKKKLSEATEAIAKGQGTRDDTSRAQHKLFLCNPLPKIN
jgi:hypothetical protein